MDDTMIELIIKASNGDTFSFQEIYKRKWKEVYFFALEMTSNPDTAQDVAQEVFIKIFKNIDKLENPETFNVWTYKIVRNTFIDMHKSMKNKVFDNYEDIDNYYDSLEERTEDFIPENFLDRNENRETLLKIIESLNNEQKLAIVMFYYNQMSCDEISEVTGTSTAAVKMRLQRARQLIKDRLGSLQTKGVSLYSVSAVPLLTILLNDEADKIISNGIENVIWGNIVSIFASGGVAAGTTGTIGSASKGVTASAKSVIIAAVSVTITGIALVVGFTGNISGNVIPTDTIPTVQISSNQTKVEQSASSTVSLENTATGPTVTATPTKSLESTQVKPTDNPTDKPTPVDTYPDHTLEGILTPDNAAAFLDYIKNVNYESKNGFYKMKKDWNLVENTTHVFIGRTDRYTVYTKEKGDYKLYICVKIDDEQKLIEFKYRIQKKNLPIPELEDWKFS